MPTLLVMVIVLAIVPPLEVITWRVFLVIPVIILQTIFNVGLACFLARLGHKIPDLTNFMSIVSRFWLYGSGVFFSIEDRLGNHPALLEAMQYNPMHAYLTLVRFTTLRSRFGSEDVDRRHSLGLRSAHRRFPVLLERGERTMADSEVQDPTIIAENVQVRYTVNTNDPGSKATGIRRLTNKIVGRQGQTTVRALRGVNFVAREG
ncbi:ABC-2 type transporter, partial [Brevibacterium siliguriense]